MTPEDSSPPQPRRINTSFCLRGEVDGQERMFPLRSGWSTLGTSRSCDVVFSVKGVSRQHARLCVEDEGVRIEDQSSRNGTFVDGKRVAEGLLPVGSQLRLGPLLLHLEPLDPDDGELGLALELSGITSHASRQFQTSFHDEGTLIHAGQLRLLNAVVDYLTLPEPDVSAALERVLAALGGDGLALIEDPEKRTPVVVASTGKLGALPDATTLGRLRADRHDPDLLTFRDSTAVGALHQPPKGTTTAIWMWCPQPESANPVEVDCSTALPLLCTVLHLVRRLRTSKVQELDLEAIEQPTELVFPKGIQTGRSPAITSLYQQMQPLAKGHMPILILGETGVGKEHLAQTLHLSSERSSGPFIAVNCAAIPTELLEAEMFGIGRGVATGVEERIGKFQQASGGTLFLDEIGDMPMPLQAKLLRTVQDGQVHPVGRAPVTVDVRIVAATHTDLDRQIQDGKFRSDLYYRLAGYELHVPPLRRRAEDLPGLLAHFLRRFTTETKKRIPGVSIKALKALTAYEWPGNIRELEHEVRRLVYLTPPGQAIDSAVLSPRVLSGHHNRTGRGLDGRGLDERLGALEQDLIHQALAQTAGNQTRAAELLQISRGGLIKRMKRLGIDPKAL